MKDFERRYLREEWDEIEDQEELEELVERRARGEKAPPTAALQRRQKDREWGRAMARYHRQRAKDQKKP